MSTTFDRSIRRSAATLVALAALAVACGKDFNSPPTTASFGVTPSPSMSVADGTSIVTLTATIDPHTPSSDARVAFATSVGTFLGGTTTVTAIADGTGTATAQLKAPSSTGTAVVTATFAGLTKTLQISFAPAPLTKGVRKIEAVPQTAPADGVSLVTLRITVDTDPRPSPNTVTLSTTAGTLVGGSPSITVPVNDSGFAYAKLRAPTDSSIASVTATSGSLTSFFDVLFAPALAEQVQLLASAFELKAGTANSITLTGTLFRRIGTPSSGLTLTFSADTAKGTTGDFGQFAPRTMIASSPAVTTRFSAGTSAYRGLVVLRVRATKPGVIALTDSTVVTVIP